MSNETALDWLARNMHEWPKCIIDGEHSDTSLWIEPSKGNVKAAFSNNQLHCFDRNQWLSRRAELQNKPSWNDAPEWANWLCQRDDGMWFWCIEEPRVSENGWETRREARAAYPSGDQIPEHVLGDWRDTLEQRPVDAVQLEQPVVVAGTGAGSEPDANTCAALIADTLIRLRDFPDQFSAHELADLHQLCDAELTKRDAVVCGGQKCLDAHWFERGELPPIGVECEFRHPVFGWTGCDIVGHYRLHAVCAPNGGEFYGGRVGDFRPIRTEREAAVSEMMAVAAANWGNLADCCEALYDAGYRKEGK